MRRLQLIPPRTFQFSFQPKTLKQHFLNEPPPMYGMTLAEQSKMEQNTANTLPPSLNHHTSKPSGAVKRTKSFQERIHKVLWGSGSPPSKPPVTTRLSILGKPLPLARTKQLRFAKERMWLYNFLQRPNGFYAYAYHTFVAFVIIMGLMFFAFSTVPGK